MSNLLRKLFLLAVTAVVVSAFAAQDPAEAQKEIYKGSNWDKFKDAFHNPAEGVSMGLDIRLRSIYGWNAYIDGRPDGHLDFQRYRARWGTKIDLSEDLSLSSRLTWEFRTWDEPKSKPQSTDFNEIIFDELAFKFKNFLGADATAAFGRQQLILGEGWLVLDGTPLDGSRTIFFDAARVTLNTSEKSTLDMIFIDQRAREEAWLKPINHRPYMHDYITEQDEYGAILYYTNKEFENTRFDGYFIYKNDNPVNSFSEGQIPPVWSKKGEIYTFGGVYDRKISDNWSFRLEGAYQTGDKEDQDLRAWGTKDRLTYSFNDERKTQFHLIYEYLSGDDPSSTGTTEQFDPLWGEWPQWSEYYVYSYAPETMIGETTNLHRGAAGLDFDLCKKARAKLAYHLLWADQNTFSARPMFSNSGSFRGQLATCWIMYEIKKNLNGHLLAEYFQPGNYYTSGNRGHGCFLRFNIEYIF
jgi:hypothetical protein